MTRIAVVGAGVAGLGVAYALRGTDADLFFAGDWVVGEGRIHAALRSGLETGERVAETR